MKYQLLGTKKRWWLGLSLIIMIPGIIAIIGWKLPFGIDFVGGTFFEIQFPANTSRGAVQEKVGHYTELTGLTVVETGSSTYQIRVKPISEENRQIVIEKIKTDFGQIQELQFQSVGPTVSNDLTKKAIYAVVLASVFIMLYLAYSFRGVTKPVSSWRFGATALIALLHDLVISVGVFAIIAHFTHLEIDASFIVALLTIMGFSVHDTIVVFDRIRENLSRNQANTAEEFENIADSSLAQTINRSLNTSLTVIITLTTLLILGGESIRAFIITLLLGVTIGTYSSIFTATPLLVIWQNKFFKNNKN